MTMCSVATSVNDGPSSASLLKLAELAGFDDWRLNPKGQL